MPAHPDKNALAWNRQGRLLVFILASSSIWCLLADFYGVCSMRRFALFVLVPATAALIAIALHDRVRGDGQLWRGVIIGGVAGLLAAAPTTCSGFHSSSPGRWASARWSRR